MSRNFFARRSYASAGLVQLTEFDKSTSKKTLAKRQGAGLDKMLIDPEHVGAIMPRITYTTLLVDGSYIHVKELYEEVLNLFGIINPLATTEE